MENSRSNVAILGCGPSGLSTAWRLLERGLSVTLFDAKDFVGGHSGSIRKGDYCMDFGPHSFFTEDEDVADRVKSLFPEGLPYVPRSVRLFMHGKYLNYPLAAEDIIRKLGPWTGFRCGASFAFRKVTTAGKRDKQSKTELSVEDWATDTFGPYLYELFFRPYTRQFWKLPCDRISSFAIPTSKKLSFFRTLGLLIRSSQRKANLSIMEREMLPSYYPDRGFGEIYERMAQNVESLGGKIYTGCSVDSLRFEGRQIVVSGRRSDGGRWDFRSDHAVSTLPISLLPGFVEPAPPAAVGDAAKELDFLSLVVLYLVVDRDSVLATQYQYSLGNSYNRLSDMNKFSEHTSPAGEDLLAIEFSCHVDDELWRSDAEELYARCKEEIRKEIGLEETEIKGFHLLRERYAYPLFRVGYGIHLETVKRYFSSHPNFHLLGRSGEFEYLDSDQCVKRGIALADDIAETLQVERPKQFSLAGQGKT